MSQRMIITPRITTSWLFIIQVKKESAQAEPIWKNAGVKPGTQIFRINKFKVCYELFA